MRFFNITNKIISIQFVMISRDIHIYYMNNLTAGIGDPYWYEWFVGLEYIVKMLNPDNGIDSVALQKSEILGWDDVVVKYKNTKVKYFQIKHTRSDDSITFGDLVTQSNGSSLIKHLSKCWSNI